LLRGRPSSLRHGDDTIADSACPRIASLPGVADAEVQVVLDPTEYQSEAAKLELGRL
jgi:hypothetical protein